MALRSVRALVAALALWLSTACDVPQEPQPSLEIGVVGRVTHLDPARANDPGALVVARFTFQTLPQISRHISHGPTASSWRFILKPGLRFSDGTPLDADAVAANLERWNAGLTSFPEFARKFPRGWPPAIQSMMQIEPSIVYINTRRPIPDLPEVLSEPYFSLGSPAAFANASAFDKKPVGNGPYAIAEYVPGDHALLIPAAQWSAGVRGATTPRYASIRIDEIPDPHTAILSLDKNDVSVVYGFPEAYLDEARADRMNPVRESATGLWCAFAVGLAKRLRVCPPGASQTVPHAEGSAP